MYMTHVLAHAQQECQPRGIMGKRRREVDTEDNSSSAVGSTKKPKQGEDALEKLLSLLSSEGSVIAGKEKTM